MQRILNDPNKAVDDMLKGFVKAHPDLVAATDNPRVLRYQAAPKSGRRAQACFVSIHAPAWGATSTSQARSSAVSPFQSTRPRGARYRPVRRDHPLYPRFNPRARVGRDEADWAEDVGRRPLYQNLFIEPCVRIKPTSQLFPSFWEACMVTRDRSCYQELEKVDRPGLRSRCQRASDHACSMDRPRRRVVHAMLHSAAVDRVKHLLELTAVLA